MGAVFEGGSHRAECVVFVVPVPTGVEITQRAECLALNDKFVFGAWELPAETTIQDVVWEVTTLGLGEFNGADRMVLKAGQLTVRAVSQALAEKYAELTHTIPGSSTDVPLRGISFRQESNTVAGNGSKALPRCGSGQSRDRNQ